MAKFPMGPTTNNVVGNPMPNHIRNTGPGKPVAPTVDGTGGFMNPGQPRGGNGNGDGNGGNTTIPAFMPGQLNALSNQMSYGYGGGQDKWRDYLRQAYSPTPVQNFDYAHFGDTPKKPDNSDNGRGHNGGGDGGGDNTNVDTWPDHSRAPYAPQMMQGAQQTGLLAQAQPQGILPGAMTGQPQVPANSMAPGMLPPQILAMLRARMMGGA